MAEIHELTEALRLADAGNAVVRWRHLRWEFKDGSHISAGMHRAYGAGLVKFVDGKPVALTTAGRAALARHRGEAP